MSTTLTDADDGPTRADEAPRRQRRPPGRRPRRRRVPASPGAGSGSRACRWPSFAWIYVASLYRLWNASLRVPLTRARDTTLIASMVKTITERGWYLSQPEARCAVRPAVLRLPPRRRDDPARSSSRSSRSFVKSFGLTMNLYYLGGFGVLAVGDVPRAAPPAVRLPRRGHRRADLHVPAVPLRARRGAPLPVDLLLGAAGLPAAGLGAELADRGSSSIPTHRPASGCATTCASSAWSRRWSSAS